ncbi:hypothetical protein MKX03_000898, partial [Papaver bracteatum]
MLAFQAHGYCQSSECLEQPSIHHLITIGRISLLLILFSSSSKGIANHVSCSGHIASSKETF